MLTRISRLSPRARSSSSFIPSRSGTIRLAVSLADHTLDCSSANFCLSSCSSYFRTLWARQRRTTPVAAAKQLIKTSHPSFVGPSLWKRMAADTPPTNNRTASRELTQLGIRFQRSININPSLLSSNILSSEISKYPSRYLEIPPEIVKEQIGCVYNKYSRVSI